MTTLRHVKMNINKTDNLHFKKMYTYPVNRHQNFFIYAGISVPSIWSISER